MADCVWLCISSRFQPSHVHVNTIWIRKRRKKRRWDGRRIFSGVHQPKGFTISTHFTPCPRPLSVSLILIEDVVVGGGDGYLLHLLSHSRFFLKKISGLWKSTKCNHDNHLVVSFMMKEEEEAWTCCAVKLTSFLDRTGIWNFSLSLTHSLWLALAAG